MHSWIESDDVRGEVLVRRGTGVVTALVPLTDDAQGLHRAEIRCDTPPGRPRSVRITVHPNVLATDAAFVAARHSMREGLSVEWTVRWTRHEWVPAHLPMSSLDLATDSSAVLVQVSASPVSDADAAWSDAAHESLTGRPSGSWTAQDTE
jgi:hypothetical protein